MTDTPTTIAASAPADLLALAGRVEEATADEQWAALRGAANMLLGEGDFGKRATFSRFLQAAAYESAAMMLIPEGMDWVLRKTADDATFEPPARFLANVYQERAIARGIFAATPALALLAACLRAHAAGARP